MVKGLVDTHCHLDLEEYHKDLREVISRANTAGVAYMIVPGINLDSSKRAVEIAHEYPQVFAACGVHPHEADKFCADMMLGIKDLCLKNDKVVAIGEVGLDYYRNYSAHANQKRLFTECIKLARDLDLPLIMHCRQAWEDFIDILDKQPAYTLKGVVHCFSADEKIAKKIIAKDLFVSFAGNITFETANGLKDILKIVPPERLLLETDSPYLTPHPHRGKRNEPENLTRLPEIFAKAYGLSPDDISRITTHNANQLFTLGLGETGKITYSIREALYLNITNRCTNRCTFCTRDISPYVKGHNLKLDREPTVEEILDEIKDMSSYKEIVFCGFGEPTLRLDVIKKISKYAKEHGKKVRLVTNGEGDLINSRPIAAEIKGLVDLVSISLNAPDEETYNHLCRSVYGKTAYNAVLDFIRSCCTEGIEVEITCLDIVGEEGIARCRDMAGKLGGIFRLRHYNVVG